MRGLRPERANRRHIEKYGRSGGWLGRMRCTVDVDVVILADNRGDMSVRRSGSDQARINEDKSAMHGDIMDKVRTNFL